MERLTETVTLSDGKKVTVQELSTMELMAASRIANSKGNGDAMSMAGAATCFAIQQVDGEKFRRPSTMAEVQSFLANVRARDFNKISAAYARLNGGGDDTGEAEAVDEA